MKPDLKREVVTAATTFIVEHVRPYEKAENIPLDEDILLSGLLDSISILQLMLAMETSFGVVLEPDPTGRFGFRSISELAEQVAELLAHRDYPGVLKQHNLQSSE